MSTGKFKYWDSTYANFRQVNRKKEDTRLLGMPDFVSESGSIYWIKDKYLYRYANHWGEVGNCIWHITGSYNAPKNWKLGKVKMSKMDLMVKTPSFAQLYPDLYRRLYRLKNSIPTHRMELTDYIFNKRVKLSFMILPYSRKYTNICMSPAREYDFSNPRIKRKNVHLYKQWFDSHIPEIEERIKIMENTFISQEI